MKEKRQDKFSKITRKESGLTESTKALISKMTNWFECFFGTGGRFPKLRIPRSGADLQVKHVTQKISKCNISSSTPWISDTVPHGQGQRGIVGAKHGGGFEGGEAWRCADAYTTPQ